MKKYLILIPSIIILLTFACKAQQPEFNKEKYYPYVGGPCFIEEIPEIINLPDSFNFKRLNYSASVSATCYFDSLGNILEINPQIIYIKNKFTNKVFKEFYYWKGWEDKAKNMSMEEAMKYSNWLKIELPKVTKMKHIPIKYRCNEVITNRNVHVLEYELE